MQTTFDADSLSKSMKESGKKGKSAVKKLLCNVNKSLFTLIFMVVFNLEEYTLHVIIITYFGISCGKQFAKCEKPNNNSVN